MKVAIRVHGLKEFRADLRRAADATPRVATQALKRGGEPLLERAKELAPYLSGDLRDSGKISVRGTRGRLVFSAPYAEGAEYGARGKWSGFAKYGPRAYRYAHRALDEASDDVAEAIAAELADVVSIYGWFRGF